MEKDFLIEKTKTYAIWKRNDKCYVAIILEKNTNRFICITKTYAQNENEALIFINKYVLENCFVACIYYSKSNINLSGLNTTPFSLN